MNLSTENIGVKNLDHLGVTSGMIDKLGFVNELDNLLPSLRKVSNGIMVKTLIISSLSFGQKALYLTPDFLRSCPLEHLLGSGYSASDFNDDSIGRCLDDLYEFGLSKLFTLLAHKACKISGVESDFVHVDSTNFSVEGAYLVDNDCKGVKITHGFAKSKRFDLKQVTLGLITTYQSAIPRYIQTFDGNSSDKESLSTMIQEYISHFASGEDAGIFICDSGVYSASNIKDELKSAQWITRVPETIKEAQLLIKETKSSDFQAVRTFPTYRYYAHNSNYGGVAQRWLLVHSGPLEAAAKKTYAEKARKEVAAVTDKLKKKETYLFKEEGALSLFLSDLGEKYPLVKIEHTEKEASYYVKAGKPKPENLRMAQQIASFKVVVDSQKIAEICSQKSRFILATNVLNTNTLSDEKMIEAYKSQATSVEKGFKFLKDPLFFAESFFVEKPSRLEALLMLMALSLLVYALCERAFQKNFDGKNKFILNQDKRKTYKPTIRLVFNLLRGIHIVSINPQTPPFCANLKDSQIEIIRLMGEEVAKYYFLTV